MNSDQFLQRVAANLRKARWKAGLTHEQIESVTERYYRDLEAGKRNPSITVLHALAEEFNVSVADLTSVPGARASKVPLDKQDIEPIRPGRKPKSHPRSR